MESSSVEDRRILIPSLTQATESIWVSESWTIVQNVCGCRDVGGLGLRLVSESELGNLGRSLMMRHGGQSVIATRQGACLAGRLRCDTVSLGTGVSWPEPANVWGMVGEPKEDPDYSTFHEQMYISQPTVVSNN
ncbi:hypothetical protein PGTUg99_021631 [Puccinia graminis f. sp. tritici]|uniref:Uncharacterized protein n=1 Tax=Puccinia graminis f. sp. tritici TaxID=56615 RepID=A0A5B0RI13_PUCGR|nr:hypothetical protein PGTUg99_021631 [Puccinia graminis f. sp. tritici]